MRLTLLLKITTMEQNIQSLLDIDSPQLFCSKPTVDINNTFQQGRGNDGNTPYIQNGTWWIDGVDTGVNAEAENGLTPYIGDNGNWYIGATDTGVPASGEVEESSPQSASDLFL